MLSDLAIQLEQSNNDNPVLKKWFKVAIYDYSCTSLSADQYKVF